MCRLGQPDSLNMHHYNEGSLVPSTVPKHRAVTCKDLPELSLPWGTTKGSLSLWRCHTGKHQGQSGGRGRGKAVDKRVYCGFLGDGIGEAGFKTG